MNDDRNKNNYQGSGYNGFLRRTINSNPNELRLKQIGPMRAHNPITINLDQQQTSGSLGDKLQVGSVVIDGSNGRISVFEDNSEVVRIGELDD